MKSADEILTGRHIHSRLPANRSIDLSQQCRRNLNESNTTQINRRSETCEIANDSATQRN